MLNLSVQTITSQYKKTAQKNLNGLIYLPRLLIVTSFPAFRHPLA